MSYDIIRVGENYMKKLILCLAFLFTLSGCQDKADELNKYSKDSIESGFDTFVQLVGYTPSEEEFLTYFETMNEQFTYYNMVFDKFRTYDDVISLKVVNDNAGIQPVEVEPVLIELVELSKEYYTKTNGYFDITSGPIIEIWQEYRDRAVFDIEEGLTPALPSITELEAAKECTGWDLVEINKEASTIYLTEECASLDVGAVAKGFATEKVAQELKGLGLSAGIINAGGNVRLIGAKPDGNDWVIGVQIPDPNGSGSLGNLKFDTDYSMVTSGDYQRFFEVDGKKYHHIIDPTTLFPSTYARSVTVVTTDSGLADILSTTLFTMSYEDGHALIERLAEELDTEIGAVWVYDETNEIPNHDNILKNAQYSIIVSDNLSDKFEVYK